MSKLRSILSTRLARIVATTLIFGLISAPRLYFSMSRYGWWGGLKEFFIVSVVFLLVTVVFGTLIVIAVGLPKDMKP